MSALTLNVRRAATFARSLTSGYWSLAAFSHAMSWLMFTGHMPGWTTLLCIIVGSFASRRGHTEWDRAAGTHVSLFGSVHWLLLLVAYGLVQRVEAILQAASPWPWS